MLLATYIGFFVESIDRTVTTSGEDMCQIKVVETELKNSVGLQHLF